MNKKNEFNYYVTSYHVSYRSTYKVDLVPYYMLFNGVGWNLLHRYIYKKVVPLACDVLSTVYIYNIKYIMKEKAMVKRDNEKFLFV